MFNFKFVIICATVASFSGATNLPSYITPCKKDQSKDAFSACILQQARNALPLFAKGVPELGIESMDPLILDDFTASAGTFKLKEKNSELKGLRKMEVKDMKWDLEKGTGYMKIFGNLTLLADYEADGRVLVIPIKGSGKMTVKMYDTEIFLKYKIKKVTGEDGREHVATYELKPTQTYGNVKLHLSNILGGATVGDTINQVLNENWRDLFKDVGPPQTKAISNKVHDIINKLYASVPYDEIIN